MVVTNLLGRTLAAPARLLLDLEVTLLGTNVPSPYCRDFNGSCKCGGEPIGQLIDQLFAKSLSSSYFLLPEAYSADFSDDPAVVGLVTDDDDRDKGFLADILDCVHCGYFYDVSF